MLMIFIIAFITLKNSGITNGIIITLVLLMIFYIVYGHYTNNVEGFFNNIEMTDKQAIAALIYRLMEKKDESFVARIFKTLSDSGVTPNSIDDTTPQKFYDAALSEKSLFDTIMETSFPPRTKTTFTFDDFFIAMNELVTSDTSSEPIAKYKPAFIKWKATKFPASVSASAPVSAPVSGSSTASAPVSGSASTPVSGSAPSPAALDVEKLLKVITPAPVQTVTPSASASEIGTVIKTSPGLQQGNQYQVTAESRTIPPMRPRCPQPRPSAGGNSCACEQPIMPDGKPFDPNMYIRKDSIPCWNCQLPI